MPTPRNAGPEAKALKAQIDSLLPDLAAYDSLDIDFLVQEHLTAATVTDAANAPRHAGHLRVFHALKAFQPASARSTSWQEPAPAGLVAQLAAELPAVAAELRAALAALDCPDCLDLGVTRAGGQGPYHRKTSRDDRAARAQIRQSIS